MTTDTKTTIPTERDKAFFNIFVTALEGGIGYWSQCHEYRWRNEDESENVLGFRATIFDVESTWSETDDQTFIVGKGTIQGETYPLYLIDRKTIEAGVKRYIVWAFDHSNSYFMRAAVHLKLGKYDELDYDADIADTIVQLALFGEIVYG